MTTDYLDDQAGEWFFRARSSRKGIWCIAWCAKTDALGDSPLAVDPRQDMHFQFAASPREALRKLKAKVLS